MGDPGIALVGVGPWGRNHLRVLTQRAVLRSAFDIDSERLSVVDAERRAPSFDALLDDPGVHGVVIATPARTHFDLARRSLEAGKHVLVEKPLTLDEQEGERLCRLATERGRVLMVGHITLFHPAIARLGELASSGELGTIRYAYSNRVNLGTVREEEDILWSFAPHDIAVLLHLLGEWPGKVTALGGHYLRADRADVTVTHLEFPDGVRAHIFVSWLHPFKEHRLVVIGDRKMAVFTDGTDGGRLALYEHPLDRMEAGAPHPRGPGNAESLPDEEPLEREIEHFLECMRTGREPLTGARSGLQVLRVLSTAQASLAEGGIPIACDPVGESRS